MISLESVSFQYDESPVLEKISAVIQPGQFIGIFGPNGGGKTTLLKLILGFIQPTKGKIAITAQTPIGYVPQLHRFDKQFPISALEVVLMGFLQELSPWGRYSTSHKQKAKEMLNKVGLQGIAEQPFGTLSGGQMQRTLIARALVSDPEILLLDEPTANVDPNAEKEILDILQSLKGKLTLLMVTHDLESVFGKVDRFFCIQRELTPYLASEVCEHFALGLYHPRL